MSIQGQRFIAKTKVPLSVRLRYWWWRRQQTPELLDMVDRINQEVVAEMIFGKGNRRVGR